MNPSTQSAAPSAAEIQQQIEAKAYSIYNDALQKFRDGGSKGDAPSWSACQEQAGAQIVPGTAAPAAPAPAPQKLD